MIIKRTALVIGLLFTAVGPSGAAQQASHGTIQFYGSIVEPGCTASTDVSVVKLKGCPTSSRGNLIDVRSIKPIGSVTALGSSETKVKLASDSGTGGRYYDQSYVLVDNSGTAVTSGSYIITLTSP